MSSLVWVWCIDVVGVYGGVCCWVWGLDGVLGGGGGSGYDIIYYIFGGGGVVLFGGVGVGGGVWGEYGVLFWV